MNKKEWLFMDKKLEVSRTSIISGKTSTRSLPITQEQYDTWKRGALIQDAMPNLSVKDREFLITGMTNDEQEEMFD